jgi:hypothetical protein
VFLKWAKLWEWRRMEKRGASVPLPAYDDSTETWDAASPEPSAPA